MLHGLRPNAWRVFADHPMDIWSVGCVIYELFTSKILFPGKSNNEMLRCFMDLKGAFPKKMVKRGAFHEKHFESDPNMSFSLEEEDPIDHRRVSFPFPEASAAFDVFLSPSAWNVLPSEDTSPAIHFLVAFAAC